MTGPIFTDLVCSACGAKMGKKPGVQVILDLICEDPLCSYQGQAPDNLQRDALIVAVALDGGSVTQTAFANDMSRQRVYQIFDRWKKGI